MKTRNILPLYIMLAILSACTTLLFVIVKLAGETNFSWLWVFSPIWISVLLVFVLFVVVLISYCIGCYIKNKNITWITKNTAQQ